MENDDLIVVCGFLTFHGWIVMSKWIGYMGGQFFRMPMDTQNYFMLQFSTIHFGGWQFWVPFHGFSALSNLSSKEIPMLVAPTVPGQLRAFGWPALFELRLLKSRSWAMQHQWMWVSYLSGLVQGKIGAETMVFTSIFNSGILNALSGWWFHHPQNKWVIWASPKMVNILKQQF